MSDTQFINSELYDKMNDTIQRLSAEVNELQAWKKQALTTFRYWNELGDALAPYADLRIGDYIPLALKEKIPALIDRYRLEAAYRFDLYIKLLKEQKDREYGGK